MILFTVIALLLTLWQAPMLGAAGSPKNLLIFGVHCRSCLCCLLIQFPTPYTPQGLPHGFLYHAVWLLGFVNIVERYLVVSFSQEPFVQSIRLAHQAAQMVAIHCVFE